MLTTSELLQSLQDPPTAPFEEVYEIFASPNRKILAQLGRAIHELEQQDPYYFIRTSKVSSTTREMAEARKQNAINNMRDDAPTPEEILANIGSDQRRYNKLKDYFIEKTKELGLASPLILYDDTALRIDIGYGPKEFQALFPDFTSADGVFKRTLHRDLGFLGKSPSDIFTPGYLTKKYKTKLDAEYARIIHAADTEFTQPLPAKIKLNLSEEPTETELVEHCLQSNTGIVIGESHEDKSPKQFLIDNMAMLKSHGVTTLYMEHILHENQSMIDAYMQSSAGVAMPRELELYLKNLDEERHLSGNATFTNVVKTAKNNGIRVVAIDTESSYQIVNNSIADLGNEEISINRYKAMNMAMLERFREYNDGGKYVVFVGSAHASTCQGVPGVSDLLGCPNIVIHDVDSKDPIEKLEQNVQYTAGKTTVSFDVLYHRNIESKASKNATVATEKDPLVSMINVINALNINDEFEATINKGSANTSGVHLRLSAYLGAYKEQSALKQALEELGIPCEEKYKGSVERLLIIRQSDPLKPNFESELQERYISALQLISERELEDARRRTRSSASAISAIKEAPLASMINVINALNINDEFEATINKGSANTPGLHLRLSAYPDSYKEQSALKQALEELGIPCEEKYKGSVERLLIIRQSEPLKPNFESELQERYTSALESMKINNKGSAI